MVVSQYQCVQDKQLLEEVLANIIVKLMNNFKCNRKLNKYGMLIMTTLDCDTP